MTEEVGKALAQIRFRFEIVWSIHARHSGVNSKKFVGPKADTLHLPLHLLPHPSPTPWLHCRTQPTPGSSCLYLALNCTLLTFLTKIVVSTHSQLPKPLWLYFSCLFLTCFALTSVTLCSASTDAVGQQDRIVCDWVSERLCCSWLIVALNSHRVFNIKQLRLSECALSENTHTHLHTQRKDLEPFVVAAHVYVHVWVLMICVVLVAAVISEIKAPFIFSASVIGC